MSLTATDVSSILEGVAKMNMPTPSTVPQSKVTNVPERRTYEPFMTFCRRCLEYDHRMLWDEISEAYEQGGGGPSPSSAKSMWHNLRQQLNITTDKPVVGWSRRADPEKVRAFYKEHSIKSDGPEMAKKTVTKKTEKRKSRARIFKLSDKQSKLLANVLEIVKTKGWTAREAAKNIGVHHTTVNVWKRRSAKSMTPQMEQKLEKWLATHEDKKVKKSQRPGPRVSDNDRLTRFHEMIDEAVEIFKTEGWSGSQIASRVGISPATACRWKQGRRSKIVYDNLELALVTWLTKYKRGQKADKEPEKMEHKVEISGPEVNEDEMSCSFCGKARKECHKLIAGAGVYICDNCLDLCNDIMIEESDEWPWVRKTEVETDSEVTPPVKTKPDPQPKSDQSLPIDQQLSQAVENVLPIMAEMGLAAVGIQASGKVILRKMKVELKYED